MRLSRALRGEDEGMRKGRMKMGTLCLAVVAVVCVLVLLSSLIAWWDGRGGLRA